MNVELRKSELCGEIKICPSKSYEQRAWAMSTLPGLNIKIYGRGNSADANASKNIATKLRNQRRRDNVFDCGESALCARMFPPIIALHTDTFVIDGHGSLLNRNIRYDLEFYEQNLGWKIHNYQFPFIISNARILPGKYHINGSHTSQVVSGLMLALSALDDDSSISVWNPKSAGYMFMTAGLADEAGAKISATRYESFMDIKIYGNASFPKKSLTIEGDWSNAAFLIAVGLTNGNIKISGLKYESLQPDRAIIEALYSCGAKFDVKRNKLIIYKSNIRGFEFNAEQCPDLIPPLCAMALHADSECKIIGANRLIGKESNRLETIIEELGKLGVPVVAADNCLTIQPCKKIKSATVNAHNDHRIAMMLATIGLSSEYMKIEGCECINKSYPDFFQSLKQLGANVMVSD